MSIPKFELNNWSPPYRAMMFAKQVHLGQFRKYTGQPYSDHLAEVAGIVSTVLPNYTDLSTAWLHDTLEDCPEVTLDILVRHFGHIVADQVLMLSDLEKEGDRAERKAKSRERLANASYSVQTIKCADLISNTSSILLHDPKFAKTYLEEKKLLLDVLTKADPLLRSIAYDNTINGLSHLELKKYETGDPNLPVPMFVDRSGKRS